MKKISFKTFALIFVVLLVLHKSNAQVEVFETFDDLEEGIFQRLDKDSTYVINFWATWCGPCVKELPYFEQLNKKYSNSAFKQILVSLDAPKKLASKVIPFIQKNKIESEVVLLADGKYNNWIDRVDPSWSGAIPITLIIKGEQRLFYEQEFHSLQELETELLKIH